VVVFARRVGRCDQNALLSGSTTLASSAMDARATSLDEFLGAVLRGAAKILGCGSTILILISEKSKQMSIRLGTMAVSYPLLARVEQVIGGSIDARSFSVEAAVDSLVYRAWRERTALETSSLSELVGGALPALVKQEMAKLIGQHRFICVPALSITRNYGVLLFQKEGGHPFSLQQREVILRYARRIGEILENDLMGRIRGAGGDAPGPAVPGASSRPDGSSDTGASFENQLLQLTLGDAVPSLFVDPSLRITSCNQATEEVLGYSPGELADHHIAELFADPREIVEILSQQSLDPRNPYCEESVVVLHHDGGLRPARVEALLLAGDHEEAVGFLVLIREVDLEQTDDVRDRLVRQERLASMGELTAQLAHELRNPLVAIAATLESLARDPALPDEHRTTLGGVTQELARMDMTLKDYLSARHDVSFAAVDLAGVVDEARRLLEGAGRLAGKRVTCTAEPGLTVRADHDALKHVVFNLLLNALEASPVDGAVHCRVELHDSTLAIVVEDRGTGLLCSAAECFQPFFTTKRDGTGLGLAVCQKIARAHGGVVEIRNREGGGCRATLSLPRRTRALEGLSA
jgi:PAS domain S-box-containing protein